MRFSFNRFHALQQWSSLIVLVCVLPATVATMLLVYYSYERERERMEETTIQTARAMILAVALVQRVLATTGLAPERLCLEITEQLLLEHSEANLASIDEIGNMGIAIAIDDFGVGYSSLGYIRRFHPSKLKIDCSLIRHVASSQDDAALVHAAISMAHGLRIEVVAEGVEHDDQRAFLQREGCDMAQGFLYATPLPATAFQAWISAWRGQQGLHP